MSDNDFRNPDWEPSDDDMASRLEDFRRVVLWRKAMAARGVKILALGLSVAEELAQMRQWWRAEGRSLHGKTPIAVEPA